MRRRFTIVEAVMKLTIFIVMEMVCLVMVTNSGIIQKYAVMGSFRSLQAFVGSRFNSLKEYFALRGTNDNLWEENVELFNQVTNLRAAISESRCREELEEFTSGRETSDFGFISARVLKSSMGGNHHNYLILNKGREDGVGENMGVVTSCGVVGIVRAVGAHNCFVLSFLNAKQQVSARIAGKEAFGPLKWGGGALSSALISDIPQHIEVSIGDTVCTSGLSSLYPAGIPLGRVTGSKVLNGIHSTIEVELFQRAENLQYVMIAKNHWREEIESLSQNAKKEQR